MNDFEFLTNFHYLFSLFPPSLLENNCTLYLNSQTVYIKHAGFQPLLHEHLQGIIKYTQPLLSGPLAIQLILEYEEKLTT